MVIQDKTSKCLAPGRTCGTSHSLNATSCVESLKLRIYLTSCTLNNNANGGYIFTGTADNRTPPQPSLPTANMAGRERQRKRKNREERLRLRKSEWERANNFHNN